MPVTPDGTVDVIRSAVKTLRSIAYDVLDKYKSGLRSKEDLGESTVAELLRTIISEKKMQFKDRKGLEIEVDCDVDVWPIAMKRIEFKRILSNLVDNAADAIGDSGLIKISAHQVEETLELSISDSGPGFQDDALAQFGKPGLTTSKFGTGVGIVSAIETLSQYGGKLRAINEANKGATLKLKIPVVA
jgi:signal transduction histidine kinase